MNRTPFSLHLSWPALVLAFLSGCNVPALAQMPPDPSEPLGWRPLLSREIWQQTPILDGNLDSRPHTTRPPMFQMPPRCLDNSVLVDLDGDPDGCPIDPAERLQVLMFSDNPYFDFRHRGDPGGVGFQKVHTQMVVADSGTSTLYVNCVAVAPAGLDNDGVADGAKVVLPSLSCYTELADGTAFHGFVGTTAHASLNSVDSLGNGVKCGMALESPLALGATPETRQVFLYVAALGYLRGQNFDPDRPQATSNWEVLPGISWQPADRCWISSGVLLPLGTTTRETTGWQLTCSWHF